MGMVVRDIEEPVNDPVPDPVVCALPIGIPPALTVPELEEFTEKPVDPKEADP